MRLRKQYRLWKEADFSAVFNAAHRREAGRVVHRKPYAIYWKRADEEGSTAPRLGISIARRVMKKAHERNRVRRVLKEFYRLHRELFHGDTIIRLIERPESFEFESLIAPLRDLESKLK